jgi:biopolymer transport protein ExbD
VAIQTVPLQLPNVKNIAVESKAEDIALSVNKEGQVFWNGALVNNDELLARLETTAKQQPQPEVHVRADQNTRYEHVGRVIVSAQRKGIMKVGFITDPPKGGG